MRRRQCTGPPAAQGPRRPGSAHAAIQSRPDLVPQLPSEAPPRRGTLRALVANLQILK